LKADLHRLVEVLQRDLDFYHKLVEDLKGQVANLLAENAFLKGVLEKRLLAREPPREYDPDRFRAMKQLTLRYAWEMSRWRKRPWHYEELWELMKSRLPFAFKARTVERRCEELAKEGQLIRLGKGTYFFALLKESLENITTEGVRE